MTASDVEAQRSSVVRNATTSSGIRIQGMPMFFSLCRYLPGPFPDLAIHVAMDAPDEVLLDDLLRRPRMSAAEQGGRPHSC
jgi:hypothetical protein